ncbi:MAG: purine phosphorylase [Defluviicoccus sp.]
MIGIVTGLAAERDCLACFPPADRPAVRVAGARADRAAAAAGELIRAGCRGLISFGLAGGLAPGLGPGTIVLADRVTDARGRTLLTDPAWRERLTARLVHGHSIVAGGVVGSDRAIGRPEEKAALARTTGALAVDMESHAVAQTAARLGVPFLVIRAIADPVARAVPAWLAGVVDAEGRTRLGAVAAGLLAHLADLPALIALGRASGHALAALRRLALDAGPAFGFDPGR